MERRGFLLSVVSAAAALGMSDRAIAAELRKVSAKLAPSAKPAPSTVPKSATVRRVVAIDAGHGGKDPGTIGIGGTYEKDVTLRVARDLASRLEATGRYKPMLTRSEDEFIELQNRVRLARSANAALFVSLHADSVPNHERRGFSVYTLSDNASDELAGALAKRENAADRIGGIDLSKHNRDVRNILMDLMHRETANNSTLMANAVLASFKPALIALEKPHRQANFVVLRAPDIPSVLVEMGFLSNRMDENLLTQSSYQTRLADRMTAAIDGFFHQA